tara:strand:+ start:199 stop:390 length:192 start_codon:yes stop_codon:yes gene_type:complete
MNEKELNFKIKKQEDQIRELYVLIDTLQTNMRSCTSYLKDNELKEISTRSFKWCMNWKAGDEA